MLVIGDNLVYTRVPAEYLRVPTAYESHPIRVDGCPPSTTVLGASTRQDKPQMPATAGALHQKHHQPNKTTVLSFENAPFHENDSFSKYRR